LVNDLYVMLLDISARDDTSDKCYKAMDVIANAMKADDGDLQAVYTMLNDIVGEQEKAGEHKVILESADY
ncbi:hypothetical protein NE541_16430, partial [Coprococcus eutactus]|nr:hypothetical protein [Coprococcus eutactus]